jgi:hypothetical protein
MPEVSITSESWENENMSFLNGLKTIKTPIRKERNFHIAKIPQEDIPRVMNEIVSNNRNNNINPYSVMHLYNVRQENVEDIFRESNRLNPDAYFTMHFIRTPLPTPPHGERPCPTCNGYGYI